AWKTIGEGPRQLLSGRSTVTHYLGLDRKKPPAPAGICVVDKSAPRRIAQTLTGQNVPAWSNHPGFFKTSKQLHLKNGDVCVPHNFVIVSHPDHTGETFVARVEEIIQQVNSVADFSSQPDGILLQKAIVDRTQARYGMPSVQLCGQWSVHSVDVTHNRSEDIVLNTAQMRDAVHLQPYRINSTPLDSDLIITQSAAQEIGSQKA
ncbi:hypothetical protein C8R47DRAFT_957896, partial [Mycena vitilis]